MRSYLTGSSNILAVITQNVCNSDQWFICHPYTARNTSVFTAARCTYNPHVCISKIHTQQIFDNQTHLWLLQLHTCSLNEFCGRAIWVASLLNEFLIFKCVQLRYLYSCTSVLAKSYLRYSLTNIPCRCWATMCTVLFNRDQWSWEVYSKKILHTIFWMQNFSNNYALN